MASTLMWSVHRFAASRSFLFPPVKSVRRADKMLGTLRIGHQCSAAMSATMSVMAGMPAITTSRRVYVCARARLPGGISRQPGSTLQGHPNKPREMTSAMKRRTSGVPRQRLTQGRPTRGSKVQARVISAEVAEEKPQASWFATVAPSVLLGLLVLELYQRGIINAMRSLGITIAQLICSLVLLTCALLMSPKSMQRTMSRLLKPAVDMVDSQIACVFIPYIVAVPISPLPTGGALWVSLGVCVVGHLFTMCVAGHLAQLAASYDEASEIERCEIENEELDADELAAKKAEVEAEVKAVPEAPMVFSKASFWSISAIGSAVAGMFTNLGLPNHVALAPAWLCATFAVYLLAKRVPAKLQRVGLFPTLTGGVAMSVLASVAGVLSGGTCADGLRLYMTGAGSFLLWFVPVAVLGLAFRVYSQRRVLSANLAPLAVSLGCAVPMGMAFSVVLGRFVGLPSEIILSTVPKCFTTGLAVLMAGSIGADSSLVASGCVVAGTMGLAIGGFLLDIAGIKKVVARGVATGTSSHAAGTAGLASSGEDGAAAVSGVSFAVAGVYGALLLELVPWFRAMLVRVATGV